MIHIMILTIMQVHILILINKRRFAGPPCGLHALGATPCCKDLGISLPPETLFPRF